MNKIILALVAVLLLCGPAAAKSLAPRTFAEIDDVEATYDRLCAAPANTSEECGLLRSQLYLAIVDELTVMHWANIEENVDPALMALRLPDREVKLQALLVLGNWAVRPEVQEATRPYLFDPHRLLAYYAARIQEKSPDKGVARLAKQFLRNHGGAVFHDLKRVYAGNEHPDYVARQLPKYGNSTPLVLADVYQREYRAAGFVTTDSLEQVLAFYRQATGQKELTPAQMNERRMQRQQAQQADLFNNPKLKEIQELTQQYQQTMDPGLIARVQELGKEIETALSEGADEGLFKLLPPPDLANDPSFAGARYFPVKHQGTQPTEMVVVTYDPVLAKTVIQLAWTEAQQQD